MPLTNFNVVLVGDNFPVSSIKISDFEYRHRALKEVMRVPVAVQAENDLVSMMVLPDRFEVTVKTPDQLGKQADGIQDLIRTFLEYVGRRTINAVGHNARWTIPGSLELRDQITGALLNIETVTEIFDGPSTGADIVLTFTAASGSKARLVIPTIADTDVVLDFNFNFDVPAQGEPAEVAASILGSLEEAIRLSENVETIVARVRA